MSSLSCPNCRFTGSRESWENNAWYPPSSPHLPVESRNGLGGYDLHETGQDALGHPPNDQLVDMEGGEGPELAAECDAVRAGGGGVSATKPAVVPSSLVSSLATELGISSFATDEVLF